MKKNTQYTSSINKNLGTSIDQEIGRIKTTNVNILLNRVRLDQKKTLRKRIIFSLVLITTISCLSLYFIIY